MKILCIAMRIRRLFDKKTQFGLMRGLSPEIGPNCSLCITTTWQKRNLKLQEYCTFYLENDLTPSHAVWFSANHTKRKCSISVKKLFLKAVSWLERLRLYKKPLRKEALHSDNWFGQIRIILPMLADRHRTAQRLWSQSAWRLLHTLLSYFVLTCLYKVR